MHFLFDIQPTKTIQKGYNPSKLEIWLTPADANGNVTLQTETTEELLGDNGNGAGLRIEKRTFVYPSSTIQPALGQYDIATGQPTISVAAVNQLLAQFDLEVV